MLEVLVSVHEDISLMDELERKFIFLEVSFLSGTIKEKGWPIPTILMSSSKVGFDMDISYVCDDKMQ